MHERLGWKAAVALLLFSLAPIARASAQIKEGFDDRTTLDEDTPHNHMDTLQYAHTLHVSPHALIFDAATRSATITFTNGSDHPIQGQVAVVFGYPVWPHGHPADTAIIAPTMAILEERDTLVAAPSSKDHFAGTWLSPIPGLISVPAHKSQQIRVKIAPPANLPVGEYWAHVVVTVNPQDQHRGAGQDTKQRYALPIRGVLPVLRDSVIVFYRQGKLAHGVTFGPGVAARFDSVGYGGPDGRDCPHSLWIRLPMHLTGNAHVDGTLLVTYKNVDNGAVVPVNKFRVSLYRDEVTHWWTHTCWVPVGKYRATLLFQESQKDVPTDKRLPTVPPIQYTLPTPFEITH
jgi:hypothetical protein